MAEVHGPKIVRDGLVLYLDAADKTSYPGSGTTWYDLSGNGFHHSLSGSPTYNGNSFTLNQTNGFTYASPITTNTLCTVVIFYKTTDTQELWVRGNNGSYYISAAYSTSGYYSENSGTPLNYVDLIRVTDPNTGSRNGNYHMWEAKNINFSAWTQFNWFLYGSEWNLNGTVASIMMYNRSLTAKESEQNYKSLKARFGI
jgi:hypothetical protein